MACVQRKLLQNVLVVDFYIFIFLPCLYIKIFFSFTLTCELFMILFCSYGLLGPSGCGKTTLLKCIVGTLKISRGHITVLGKPPAFPGHEVPGKMVGYMPQVNCKTSILSSLTVIYSKVLNVLKSKHINSKKTLHFAVNLRTRF